MRKFLFRNRDNSEAINCWLFIINQWQLALLSIMRSSKRCIVYQFYYSIKTTQDRYLILVDIDAIKTNENTVRLQLTNSYNINISIATYSNNVSLNNNNRTQRKDENNNLQPFVTFCYMQQRYISTRMLTTRDPVSLASTSSSSWCIPRVADPIA